MDLHSTLPDFPTGQHAHVLSALEKAEITVKELLLFDALEIAKQTQVPVNHVRSFVAHVLDVLHEDLGVNRYRGNAEDEDLLLAHEEPSRRSEAVVSRTYPLPSDQQCISTLDPVFDGSLAGGIRAGYVTEIAGESGCGKTQLLLQLLLAVQLPPPRGLGRGALYIATESELPTSRLSQLLSDHPFLSSLAEDSQRPTLENIRSITTIDLESQNHILNFQVPVAVERYGIGLVVIDSVTANYRVELSAENPDGLITRARELKSLGHFSRNLAVKHNIAIVVANQVSDQFADLDDPLWMEGVHEVASADPENPVPQQSSEPSQIVQSSPLQLHHVRNEECQSSPNLELQPGARCPSSPHVTQDHDTSDDDTCSLDLPDLDTMLSLEYQKPFFTGWGDPYSFTTTTAGMSPTGLKAPALGLVWTNQIACRIVLKAKQQRPQDQDETADLANDRFYLAPKSEEKNAPYDPGADTLAQPDVGAEAQGGDNVYNSPETGDHRVGDEKGRSANHCITTEDEEANRTPHSRTSVTRRIRIMEVVFSPWTSGTPGENNSAEQDWEDIEEDDGAEDEEYDSATDRPIMLESVLPPVNSVEFEILPSGIRGLRRD